jgi:hypothetical protein
VSKRGNGDWSIGDIVMDVFGGVAMDVFGDLPNSLWCIPIILVVLALAIVWAMLKACWRVADSD